MLIARLHPWWRMQPFFALCFVMLSCAIAETTVDGSIRPLWDHGGRSSITAPKAAIVWNENYLKNKRKEGNELSYLSCRQLRRFGEADTEHTLSAQGMHKAMHVSVNNQFIYFVAGQVALVRPINLYRMRKRRAQGQNQLRCPE